MKQHTVSMITYYRSSVMLQGWGQLTAVQGTHVVLTLIVSDGR